MRIEAVPASQIAEGISIRNLVFFVIRNGKTCNGRYTNMDVTLRNLAKVSTQLPIMQSRRTKKTPDYGQIQSKSLVTNIYQFPRKKKLFSTYFLFSSGTRGWSRSLKKNRAWQDSNLQSSDSKSDALSITLQALDTGCLFDSLHQVAWTFCQASCPAERSSGRPLYEMYKDRYQKTSNWPSLCITGPSILFKMSETCSCRETSWLGWPPSNWSASKKAELLASFFLDVGSSGQTVPRSTEEKMNCNENGRRKKRTEPGRTRTYNLLIRSQTRYPLRYRPLYELRLI